MITPNSKEGPNDTLNKSMTTVWEYKSKKTRSKIDIVYGSERAISYWKAKASKINFWKKNLPFYKNKSNVLMHTPSK